MPRRSAPGPLARRLGARIRALREEAGLTQEKLAWECGFAKAYLSQVESGQGAPSLAALFALAKRLDVDPALLLAFDPRKPLHRLLEAVRRQDGGQVRDQLAQLGLDAAPPASTSPAPERKAAERAVPRRPR